jgi:hypothetical protein
LKEKVEKPLIYDIILLKPEKSYKTNIKLMSSRKKLIFNTILIIIGVALIIFGIIKIASGLRSSMISDVIDKFNEVYDLGNQIGTEMKTIGALLNQISSKEQAKDYSGAAADAFTSLSELDNVISQFKAEEVKLSEFKNLLQKNSDLAVKKSGLELVDLLEQRNTASLDLATNTKQYVILSRIYYEQLASGKKEAQIDLVQANTLDQKVRQASQTLSALAPQVNTAIENFAKSANLKLESTTN